jgi:hypothetical protein
MLLVMLPGVFHCGPKVLVVENGEHEVQHIVVDAPICARRETATCTDQLINVCRTE